MASFKEKYVNKELINPCNVFGCKNEAIVNVCEEHTFQAGQESISVQRIVVDTVNLHKKDWMEQARQDFAEEVLRILNEHIKNPAIWKKNQQEALEDVYDEIETLTKKAGNESLSLLDTGVIKR